MIRVIGLLVLLLTLMCVVKVKVVCDAVDTVFGFGSTAIDLKTDGTSSTVVDVGTAGTNNADATVTAEGDSATPTVVVLVSNNTAASVYAGAVEGTGDISVVAATDGNMSAAVDTYVDAGAAGGAVDTAAGGTTVVASADGDSKDAVEVANDVFVHAGVTAVDTDETSFAVNTGEGAMATDISVDDGIVDDGIVDAVFDTDAHSGASLTVGTGSADAASYLSAEAVDVNEAVESGVTNREDAVDGEMSTANDVAIVSCTNDSGDNDCVANTNTGADGELVCIDKVSIPAMIDGIVMNLPPLMLAL